MRAAKQIQLTSLRSSLLSEVTDVSFVPRKLIAHRHFVQRTPTRSMRQVRLSISHPAQCEHRGWLVKYIAISLIVAEKGEQTAQACAMACSRLPRSRKPRQPFGT